MGGAAGAETASAISIDHVGPALPDDDGIITVKKAGKDILFGSVSLSSFAFVAVIYYTCWT